ncbi:hypothetical protein YC2023_066619 [Brassica napus]
MHRKAHLEAEGHGLPLPHSLNMTSQVSQRDSQNEGLEGLGKSSQKASTSSHFVLVCSSNIMYFQEKQMGPVDWFNSLDKVFLLVEDTFYHA